MRKARSHEVASLALSGLPGVFMRGDDIQWLRETHCPELGKNTKAAILYGNEDCPDRVEAYTRKDPEIHDFPEIWINNDAPGDEE